VPPLLIVIPECSVWLAVVPAAVVPPAVPDAVPLVGLPVVEPVPLVVPVAEPVPLVPVPLVVPAVPDAVPLVPAVPVDAVPVIVPLAEPGLPLALAVEPALDAFDALMSTNSLPTPMPVPIVPPRPP
jgi:hypothetical protein